MSDGQRSELVFVYGTLRAGGSNADRMDGARLLGPATMSGRLVRVSWYPGLVVDADAEGGCVRGEVYAIEPSRLAALDRFEGCDPRSGRGDEYRRIRRIARFYGGGEIKAWVWAWTGPVERTEPIAGGDWLGVSGREP